MKRRSRALLDDRDIAPSVPRGPDFGRSWQRHTCRHRARELLAIIAHRTPGRQATRTAPGIIGAAAMKICFFGSSLVSSYWNGAATYYRGMLKALARSATTSPSSSPTPSSAKAIAISKIRTGRRWWSTPRRPTAGSARLRRPPAAADLLVKASGVGVFDPELENALADDAVDTHMRDLLGRRCPRDAG